MEPAAAEQRLNVAGRGDGYGPSDQTSFYAAGIPVLHLFTGAHEQYHSPDDDAATLNAEGAARIAELTATLGHALARGDVDPRLRARVRAARARGRQPRVRRVPRHRPRLPARWSDQTGGVLLADTRPAVRPIARACARATASSRWPARASTTSTT